MASARRSELAELTEVDGLVPADQPKLLVMHGRGGAGNPRSSASSWNGQPKPDARSPWPTRTGQTRPWAAS
jgi:hypothetical protein